MADQIASALEKAHSQGIVHRDIKLGNCIRMTIGDDLDYIKVLDFGIAKFLSGATEAIDAPRTATDVWMGTAEYMAPELFSGQADERVDIYALGILLYKLTTGRTPFRGGHMEVSTQLMLRDADPPSRLAPQDIIIPPKVDALILRAIARNRDERIPTMTAFRAEFRSLLSSPDSREMRREEDTTLVRGTRKAWATGPRPPEAVTATTMRPDAAAVQATAVLAHASPRRRWAYKLLAGWLVVALLTGLVWLLASSVEDRQGEQVATEQAELRAQSEPETVGQTDPPPASGPVVTVPEVETKSRLLELGPELTGMSGDLGASSQGSVPGERIAPTSGDSASRGPVKPGTRKKPSPVKPKVEEPWRSSLEADFKVLDPGIQTACFVAQRAPRGTKIVLDIEVGAARKAIVNVVTAKFPVISDCIRYKIRAHFFSEGSRGGSIRWSFVAK